MLLKYPPFDCQSAQSEIGAKIVRDLNYVNIESLQTVIGTPH